MSCGTNVCAWNETTWEYSKEQTKGKWLATTWENCECCIISKIVIMPLGWAWGQFFFKCFLKRHILFYYLYRAVGSFPYNDGMVKHMYGGSWYNTTIT